jgi:hypothetical protein
MAEVRRLKTGRWRIYEGQKLIRDPSTGQIATFESIAEARRWWSKSRPAGPTLQEANKCSDCGAYFGASTPWTVYQGRPYHLAHVPAKKRSGYGLMR